MPPAFREAEFALLALKHVFRQADPRFLALLGAGMGLPISEDAVLLATGAFAESGAFATTPALLTCMAGVLMGDFFLFSFGRYFGRRAFEWNFFRKIMTEDRQTRAEALYARHGGAAVFLCRFLVGFRVPGFATAGLLNVSPWKFLLFDGLAVCITGPTVFFLGYTFADRLDDVRASLAAAELYLLAGVALVALISILAWRRKRRAEKLVDGMQPRVQHDADASSRADEEE